MPPVWCYRDSRTALGVENAKAKVDWPVIYAETGIQFMAFNTIYQIATEPPERLAAAKQLLLIGDAFNYFLLRRGAQRSFPRQHHAALQSADHKRWSKKLFAALGLREDLFAPICPSGTRLGPMKKNLATETGLPQIEVIATCSHDTGAAVAAVPASGENWAYLSSGTWSLMGVEWPQPVINDQSRNLGFTNEIGYGNSVRLLKNIVGLWLIQESPPALGEGRQEIRFCRARTARRRRAAVRLAHQSRRPAVSQPRRHAGENRRFLPRNRPARAGESSAPACAAFTKASRCFTASRCGASERLIGKKIERLHIVGGGSKDTTLNQFTANAMKIPVLAGPTECAALGNILMQAIALGHLASHAAAREVVRNSFELKTFTPQAAAQWDAAAARFEKLLS